MRLEETNSALDRQELMGLLQARQVVYASLARAFAAAADQQMLDMLENEAVQAMFDLVGVDGAPGSVVVATAVEVAQANSQELKAEFTRLFEGPGKPLASPWESVYLLSDGTLFTTVTLAVRQSLRAEGFKSAGYPNEPDDHMGTELSFMAALAQRAAEACAQGDSPRMRAALASSGRFLSDHLAKWAGPFNLEVQKALASGRVGSFYPALSRLVVAMCEADATIVQELLV